MQQPYFRIRVHLPAGPRLARATFCFVHGVTTPGASGGMVRRVWENQLLTQQQAGTVFKVMCSNSMKGWRRQAQAYPGPDAKVDDGEITTIAEGASESGN